MAQIGALVAGFCTYCKKRFIKNGTLNELESNTEDFNMPHTLEFAGTDQFYEITKIDKHKKTNETQLILVRKDYSSLIEEVNNMKQRFKILEEKMN